MALYKLNIIINEIITKLQIIIDLVISVYINIFNITNEN